jgi:hypothetical protein
MAGLEVQGTIDGNVEVSVGDPADPPGQFVSSAPPTIAVPAVRPGLHLADSARINGQLTYTSQAPMAVGNQVAGGVVYHARPAEVTPVVTPVMGVGATLVDQLRRLVALTLVGLLLVWLVPGWTRRLVDTVQQRPLPTFGWGLVAGLAIMASILGLGLATGVLAATLGASTLFGLMALALVLGFLGEATLITAAITFTAFVTQAMASYLGGRWLLERIQPQWATHRVIPLFVGLVLFVALTAIPILGGIVGFAAAVFGLGALWIWASESLRPPRAPSTLASPLIPSPLAPSPLPQGA